jgi:hypothetical protein
MNGETPVNRDALLEAFAAELALAAYDVAILTKTQGTWLDLELALWRALTEKVKTWGQENGLGPLQPDGDAAKRRQERSG